MNVDSELELWQQEWRSDASVPPDLLRRVERESRWMRVALALDVLVTIVVGGGITWLAIRSPQPDMTRLAAVIWVFLAVAWAFCLRINRGNWSLSAVDTASFVDLSLRRCRSRLATIRFAAWLFASELAFSLGWTYNHSHRHRRDTPMWLFLHSPGMELVWIFSLAFVLGLLWYRRKKRAELAYLLKLREETTGPGERQQVERPASGAGMVVGLANGLRRRKRRQTG